tara:strand:+ start:837 stop:1058 length:222 start_codon:yes stop_codon:yes gene_type:complete
MRKGKAELVSMFSSKALSPDWTPTITEDELLEANQNLETQLVPYRWRWLDLKERVVTLAGAAYLHAEAHNVAA